MALDPGQLKILTTAGEPDEQQYAKAVLPVRQYGNFLLCTLLLGNVLGKCLLQQHSSAFQHETKIFLFNSDTFHKCDYGKPMTNFF